MIRVDGEMSGRLVTSGSRSAGALYYMQIAPCKASGYLQPINCLRPRIMSEYARNRPEGNTLSGRSEPLASFPQPMPVMEDNAANYIPQLPS